ncbi:MAG: P1 family peptidase [Turicibacter sp.]|nr:P1 family peptidase [Turicibacter sp.]
MINDKFLIGHATDEENGTGVTVILAKEGAVGGVSVRGAAPGTRETDLLNPVNAVQTVHAVVLAGGSAFGLDASSGVMKYLHEQGVGFQAGKHIVPIVTSAIIFDLNYKRFAFPDQLMGYEAAKNASVNNVLQGHIGAGCGATVGKILGPDSAGKGGLGMASMQLKEGVTVTAIVVTNALGDIYDEKGEFLAGVKHPDQRSSIDLLLAGAQTEDLAGQNTTIGCVLTNAKLSKSEVNKLADISHDGLALSIKPVHTAFDGDTMFALSSNEVDVDFLILQTACVQVVQQAIVNSVK